MPTGYTQDVINGKVTTAQEFAKECARAFMWNMRDTDRAAELRMPERNDSYYAEDLPRATDELIMWDHSSEEQKYAQWSEYAEEIEKRAVEHRAEAAANRERLTKLLAEVESIGVPETHAEFKKFMVDQLTETIRYDGTFREDYYKIVPYERWAESRRSELLKAIHRAADGLREAQERHEKSVAWVTTLAKTYGLTIK
jgi:hypothetical protein